MELLQGKYKADYRLADRRHEDKPEGSSPVLDLTSLAFETSLSFSAHHHRARATKTHGPAAMTAKNSKRR